LCAVEIHPGTGAVGREQIDVRTIVR